MAGGGVFLLLALTAVMALASFLAGALPLSMSLSQSQLRLISSIGIGILVGTSMIIIIPEGIEAITEASSSAHAQNTRCLRDVKDAATVRWVVGASVASRDEHPIWSETTRREDPLDILHALPDPITPSAETTGTAIHDRAPADEPESTGDGPMPVPGSQHAEVEVPTFYIGLSMILGFILMFLVDRLPRHASDNFVPPPPPRHISLSNLGGSALSGDEEESEGFLGSLTPTPKQSRSLATTTGLVIHAAADGIAMGASSASSDTTLGFIVFIAIMVHKAPAAFGLTSILLKQGLSKRAARGHLIVFSLASPFGAWLTFILVSFLGGRGDGSLNQWWVGMLLLFSAGTFL
ncbi:Uu.00g001100.m01.CDS01 [Anthostomella pinea]|uniref:Uu.00g001100.m01.CDS01 n=1 Tax=Anthostomella pinea TaxID=933095 RepID=A0AAI8VKA1_9PEZI|nr:Uu.00g001100.m01.CDS01 [Anthostomella pinea]